MASAHRYHAGNGAITIMINGKPFKAVLTLSALAELEALFGVNSLEALARALMARDHSSQRIDAILRIGFQAAGHAIEPSADITPDGGPLAALDAVSSLVAATFSQVG